MSDTNENTPESKQSNIQDNSDNKPYAECPFCGSEFDKNTWTIHYCIERKKYDEELEKGC